MARENYSYIKQQKELANKKKKEERRLIKLAKKNKDNPEQTAGSGGAAV
ncbi:MAG: hypothetical protein WCY09_04415 [Candidatus Omnitrophota bacterium]